MRNINNFTIKLNFLALEVNLLFEDPLYLFNFFPEKTTAKTGESRN